MNEPNAFKQPTRADKAIQASVIAQVRHTTPEKSDDEVEAEAETPEPTATRFATEGALRSVTLVDGDIEYCADVMDEESERVWHIAVWPNPPGTEFEVSHCFVVGSKGQARDILRSLTGAPAFVDTGQQALGGRQSGYAGRGAKKPGRTQQKTG